MFIHKCLIRILYSVTIELSIAFDQYNRFLNKFSRGGGGKN
jgi:hypothetical protein